MEKKILGERIRTAREKRGLSQVELAKLVKRDQRTISEVEGGKRKLAANDLPDFAMALEVPLLYFFEGEYDVTDLEFTLLKAFRGIPTEGEKLRAIALVNLLSQPLMLLEDSE